MTRTFTKKIGDFDDRIPEPPSLRRATSLKVKGDWTFGSEVVVAGDVSLDTEKPQTIPDGTVLTGEAPGAKKSDTGSTMLGGGGRGLDRTATYRS
ncbi:UTP-glucose-1-phosphate uridylyltransferase [Cutibacterium acnes JCM 18909]|nr:UTP-glucose-1-phosphate uridylyltransferase [Cutibacterium acnes JCM 18909]